MRLLSALLAAVAFAPAGAATTGSGLRGTVMRGPTRPVCQVGVPCSAPAPAVRVTFVRGDIRRSTTTGADGRYRIALAPGTYAVEIAGARFGYTPRQVLVPASRWAVRNFQVDTGIR